MSLFRDDIRRKAPRLLAAVAVAAFAVSVFAQERKPLGFSFEAASGLSNRFITPNGDRKNDEAVFTFSNPRDSQVSGTVYDLKGAKVADMSAGPGTNQLKWDPKASIAEVRSGLYLYVLWAEGRSFSGVLVVIR